LQRRAIQWRIVHKKIVFTNGCFDILHPGHIASLAEAANQGDYLIVGVNADSSVRRLKGDGRPINDENARALVLASLSMVDAVVIFSEDTPLEIIKSIMPDVLVKGGDYTIENIAGANEVIAAGGRVFLNPIVPDFSTTTIINKMSNTATP
jgi:D-beta-D-heptose 7-phosphate kinase/D-beta-D-heptose 1-phosphate adenosyltransferase